MIHPPGPYCLRRMQVDDIPQVVAIEQVSFPTPWPASAYHYELTRNEFSYCTVLETVGGQDLLGYGCFWLVVDEAHISTIAVAPAWRGRRFGELLLLAMIDEALPMHVVAATLEVRLSNVAAQALYAKYGFRVVGRRKRYYTDNREDALIMTAEPLDDAYLARLAELQQDLFDHLRSGQ